MKFATRGEPGFLRERPGCLKVQRPSCTSERMRPCEPQRNTAQRRDGLAVQRYAVDCAASPDSNRLTQSLRNSRLGAKSCTSTRKPLASGAQRTTLIQTVNGASGR